jgi:phage-related minor tail protein
MMTLRGLGIAGVVGGIAASVVLLGKAWYEGGKEAEEFNKQLILTGNYAGKTSGQLQALARNISGNGVTQHAAAAVLAQVVGSGAFGGADVERLPTWLPGCSRRPARRWMKLLTSSNG